jgi:hypothetical protein
MTARHHYLEDLAVRNGATLRTAGAAGPLLLVEHRALGIEDWINPIGLVPCPGNPLTELHVQFNAPVFACCICSYSNNIGADILRSLPALLLGSIEMNRLVVAWLRLFILFQIMLLGRRPFIVSFRCRRGANLSTARRPGLSFIRFVSERIVAISLN